MKIPAFLTRWAQPRERRSARHLLGGRVRVSTIGLLVAFIALFWVYQTVEVPSQPSAPGSQVVPPGFVPDPDYTWVPRTQVRTRPPEPTTTTATPTTTTTTPTTTPTTTTTDTPGPDDPSLPAPTTTVVDPDGSGGLLPSLTLPVLPPAPGTTPTAPARSAN